MSAFLSRNLSSGEASSSESDGEAPPKIMSLFLFIPQTKKLKNNVWQSVLYENTLENAFKCADIDSKKEVSVERGEESYAFNTCDIGPERMDSDIVQTKPNRKRNRDDVFPPRSYDMSIPRSHYGVNFESSPEEITKAIADFLGEQRVDLIDKIVQTLGAKRALEFCYLTEDIENLGGLPTADGTRLRTPGGTYFFIVRGSNDISKAEKKIIFREDAVAKLRKKRIRKEQRRREKLQSLAATSATETREESAVVDIEDIPSPKIEIE
nr:hypothetical transcript [Hymenolepis microstoma]